MCIVDFIFFFGHFLVISVKLLRFENLQYVNKYWKQRWKIPRGHSKLVSRKEIDIAMAKTKKELKTEQPKLQKIGTNSQNIYFIQRVVFQEYYKNNTYLFILLLFELRFDGMLIKKDWTFTFMLIISRLVYYFCQFVHYSKCWVTFIDESWKYECITHVTVHL